MAGAYRSATPLNGSLIRAFESLALLSWQQPPVTAAEWRKRWT